VRQRKRGKEQVGGPFGVAQRIADLKDDNRLTAALTTAAKLQQSQPPAPEPTGLMGIKVMPYESPRKNRLPRQAPETVYVPYGPRSTKESPGPMLDTWTASPGAEASGPGSSQARSEAGPVLHGFAGNVHRSSSGEAQARGCFLVPEAICSGCCVAGTSSGRPSEVRISIDGKDIEGASAGLERAQRELAIAVASTAAIPAQCDRRQSSFPGPCSSFPARANKATTGGPLPPPAGVEPCDAESLEDVAEEDARPTPAPTPRRSPT